MDNLSQFDQQIKELKDEIEIKESVNCLAGVITFVIALACAAVPIAFIPGVGIVIGIFAFFLTFAIYVWKVERARREAQQLRRRLHDMEVGRQAEILARAESQLKKEASSPPAGQPAASRYSLQITAIPENREEAMKILQEELGIDLVKAVVILDTLPAMALENVAYDAAEMTVQRLNNRGFTTRIVTASE